MAIPFRQIRDSDLDGSRAERADRPFPIGDVDDEVARDARASALDSASVYVNSELSLLQFQRRVLEEACDSRNPLLGASNSSQSSALISTNFSWFVSPACYSKSKAALRL